MKSLPPVSPTSRGYAAVRSDVGADVLPHRLEHGGAAGEVDAGQLRRVEGDLGDHHRVAGHEVDHARRQPGGLEQPQGVVGAQHRARRRLPDDRVAHQRRRGGEVAADGGEVEGRDRVDEALEAAIVALVPHRGGRDRLLGHQVGGERDVEAPEVDQLAGRVDLRLEHRLRLPEHGRGVERVAPAGREQVGGLEEHRRPVLPGPAGPLDPGVAGGGDRRGARPRAAPGGSRPGRGRGRGASPNGRDRRCGRTCRR